MEPMQHGGGGRRRGSRQCSRAAAALRVWPRPAPENACIPAPVYRCVVRLKNRIKVAARDRLRDRTSVQPSSAMETNKEHALDVTRADGFNRWMAV